MNLSPKLSLAALSVLALAGCSRQGEIDATGGISAVRSACPVVAVAAGTGDITLFDPPASRDAQAVDVVAALTNVRGACNEGGDQIGTVVSFEVQARRRDTAAPRDVTLPYFVAVTRAGTQLVAKQVSQVAVHFDAGQDRATTTGRATVSVSRAAATLPDEIRRRVTQRRKAGNQSAAVDPLSQPEVRDAVLQASFEALVGFQLTDEQLRYNVTR